MTDENTNDTNGPTEPGEESTEPQTAEEAPTGGGELKPDEKTMGMLAHLLGIITCFVGPLIIWLIKKDDSEFVNDQGKESLNWQITLAIIWVPSIIIGLVPVVGLVTCIIGPVLFIATIIFCIMGGLAANKGERYRYPVAIRLIK